MSTNAITPQAVLFAVSNYCVFSRTTVDIIVLVHLSVQLKSCYIGSHNGFVNISLASWYIVLIVFSAPIGVALINILQWRRPTQPNIFSILPSLLLDFLCSLDAFCVDFVGDLSNVCTTIFKFSSVAADTWMSKILHWTSLFKPFI